MSLRTLHAYARVVALTVEVTLRQSATDAFILFTVLVQPLLIAVLALWVLRGQGSEVVIFVVVGSGLTGLWSSLLYISGNSINHERWSGTLETLVGMPTPLQVVVLGKNLAHVSQSLASMVASYTLAILFFGYSPRLAHPLLFAGSVVFTVVAFVCFGLVIAPLFVMNPDVQRWQNGLEFPVYILSGFLFPIALLPGWTTPLSYLLAPYWAARALHSASSGTGAAGEVFLSWGMMLVFCLLYLWLSGRLFRRLLYKARADATLGLQ